MSTPVQSLVAGHVLGAMMMESGRAGSMIEKVEPLFDADGNYEPMVRVTIAGETFLLLVIEETA